MSVHIALLSTAELRAVREVLVVIRENAARGLDPFGTKVDQDAVRRVWFSTRSDVFDRGLASLDRAVRWDRAGRIYFGLSPASTRVILRAMKLTQFHWDDGSKDARFLRWFVRRLTKGLQR